MNADTPWLVADVGGTNIRLALADGPGAPPRDIRAYKDADYPDIGAVIAAYLEAVGEAPKAACVAVAGPVVGEVIQLTNRGWQIDIAALRKRFALSRLLVINDFEALALALPSLDSGMLAPVGGGRAMAGKAMAVLGPGTGLGVAGLVPVGQRWVPIPGEGGHVNFAAGDVREIEILRLLRQRFERVSAERVLSGPGLANLFEALVTLDGTNEKTPAPDAITAGALDGSSPTCRAALELFCALLGSFAGDVALTFGAQGGVFIAGGIAPRILPFLAASRFRARFEDKGRIRPMMAAIPTSVITAPLPAFPGTIRKLEQG